MGKRALLDAALAARKNAYAPYSGYRVGAALLAKDGRVFTGSNLENASYGATICAERSAFAAAVSAGVREFSAIAVAGGKGAQADPVAPPCGICRQVMAEFCAGDLAVILGDEKNLKAYSLNEILPLSFDASNLEE